MKLIDAMKDKLQALSPVQQPNMENVVTEQVKEETLEITIPNGESRIPTGQRSILTYARAGLVACELEQRPDEYVMTFYTEGLLPMERSSRLDRVEKLRLLVNCADLEQLAGEYAFSMAPDNLMYDRNLLVQVLRRDITPEGQPDFLRQYKSLAAAVLVPQYRFEDYLKGGDDLFEKKRLLQDMAAKKTVKGVQKLLAEEYRKERRHLKFDVKQISNTAMWTIRIITPMLVIATLIMGVFTWRAYHKDLPYQQKLLTASNDYINEEYIAATEALADISVEALPLESRYLLSRSYVTIEGLTDEEKKTVLDSITIKTEETVMNFWIRVGRGDYSGAVDDAKKLGDDDMLLFALAKQSVVVKNDVNMDGEEKAALLEDLESQISSLQEKREKEDKALSTAEKPTAATTTPETATTTQPVAGEAGAAETVPAAEPAPATENAAVPAA